MLSLALALALTFGIARRQTRAPRLIVLAIFAAAAALFVAGPLRQVMAMRLQASALDYSASERMDLYRLAWDQFVRHPLFGVGLNVFSVIAHRLHGVDTVPHNLELGFLAELGLPGLVMALAWVWAVGDGARRALRAARTPRERSLALGLVAAFLGFAFHNQVESTLYGQQYKMLLVVYAAAAWAIGRAWERRAEAAGPGIVHGV
jgi:O-antigen ligase